MALYLKASRKAELLFVGNKQGKCIVWTDVHLLTAKFKVMYLLY